MGRMVGKTAKDRNKDEEEEIAVAIGRMAFHAKESVLKPVRGKRVVL